MNESEAIKAINMLGDRASTSWKPVHWPHIDLRSVNLERLAEAVIDARLDTATIAFGDDFDPERSADDLEEAWRTDEFQARFAPEGVFVCAGFSILLTIKDASADDEVIAEETLVVKAEFCLSFSEKHHTRPFIDFMDGAVRRNSDGFSRKIDPFSMFIEPEDAVAWRLNGAGT